MCVALSLIERGGFQFQSKNAHGFTRSLRLGCHRTGTGNFEPNMMVYVWFRAGVSA